MAKETIAHHDDVTPAYPCRRCGKAYATLSGMTLHVLSHTGTQPFACPKPGCNKKFSQKGHLTRHLKCTHLGQKMTACSICQESMISSTLEKHMQKAHGNMQPCRQCSRKRCINLKCRLGSHCHNPTHPSPSMKKPERSLKGSALPATRIQAMMTISADWHVRDMPYSILSPPQTPLSQFSPPPSPSPSVASWATPPSPSTASFSSRSSSPSSAFDGSFSPAWSSATSDFSPDSPCLSSSAFQSWDDVHHTGLNLPGPFTSPPSPASSAFTSFAEHPPASPTLSSYSLASSTSGTSCSSAAPPSPALSNCSSLYDYPSSSSRPPSAPSALSSSIEKMLVEALEAGLVLDPDLTPYGTTPYNTTPYNPTVSPAYIGFCTPALPADVHWAQAHVAVAMDLGAVARLDLEALLDGFGVDRESDGRDAGFGFKAAEVHGYWDAPWDEQMDVDEEQTVPERWH